MKPGSAEDYEERRRWAENLKAQGRAEAAVQLLRDLEKDLSGAGNLALAVAVRHQAAEWLEAAAPASAPAPPVSGAAVGGDAGTLPPPAEGPTQTAVLRAIRAASVLEELSPEEVEAIVASSGLAKFGGGEVVVREGTRGDALFVVTRGVLDVATLGPQGAAIRLGTVEVGDFFGEVSLLTGRPRTATVTARPDTECLRIGREKWESLAAKYPRLRQRLEREIETRARLAADAAVDDLRRRRAESGEG